MTFTETVTAVLAANILTVWVIYGFWRLKRDEGWRSIAILLGACIAVVVIAYDARP